MAIQREQLHDDAQATVYREFDSAVGYEGIVVEPKAGTAAANEELLRSKARAALGANVAYLAIGSPSNAQNLAQIRALTRQVNGVMRMLLQQFDSTDGT